MDWNNINLNSNYERAQDILDPYTSDTLLLEIACNLKEINRETVREQAMLSLKTKYETAIEIINANLDNFTAEALKERAIQ
jgi:hypothetical protein